MSMVSSKSIWNQDFAFQDDLKMTAEPSNSALKIFMDSIVDGYTVVSTSSSVPKSYPKSQRLLGTSSSAFQV